MSGKNSKQATPLRISRSKNYVRNVRWRSAEERKEAKRKIEAIRRATAQKLIEHSSLNVAVLRSPKALLGILAVMVLLGLLLINAFRERPTYTVSQLPLQQNRARRSLKVAATALTLFRVHTGSWPTQRLGLYALAKNYGIQGWRGPYINWAYKDPWGTPYVYKMPISPFEIPELYSCGPDTLPDTNDDIRVTEADFTCDEGTWRRAEPTETAPTNEVTQ